MRFLIRILTIFLAFLCFVVAGLIVRVDFVGAEKESLLTPISDILLPEAYMPETASHLPVTLEKDPVKENEQTLLPAVEKSDAKPAEKKPIDVKAPKKEEKQVEKKAEDFVVQKVKKKKLSVILTGGGKDYYLTLQSVRDMPEQVAISLDPSGKRLAVYAKAAALKKHMVFIEVPAAKNDASTEMALQNMREVLTRFDGYVGVVGVKFDTLKKKSLIDAVLGEIAGRRLLFVDSYNITAKSSHKTLPKTIQVDRIFTKKQARKLHSFDKIEHMFDDKEHVILMVPMHKTVLENLKEWFNSFKIKNINLVPIS